MKKPKTAAKRLVAKKFQRELSEAEKAKIFMGLVEKTMEKVMEEFTNNDRLLKDWAAIEGIVMGEIKSFSIKPCPTTSVKTRLERCISSLVESAIVRTTGGESWLLLTHWEILSKRIKEQVRLTAEEAQAEVAKYGGDGY